MPTGGEATPKIKPVEIAIASELHEKNRASYEDKQKQEEEERIRMVMEYIHFVMPRIADQGTVNHICGEVNNWIRLHSYKPKPIKGRLTKDVSNIPLLHFVWNISERFMYKKYYTGDTVPVSSAPFPTGVRRYGLGDHQKLQGRAVKDTNSHRRAGKRQAGFPVSCGLCTGRV